MKNETQKVDVLKVMEYCISTQREVERVTGGQFGSTQAVADITEARASVAELIAERDALRKGLEEVASLIDNSDGVAGLHLNGDVATWSDLRTGGRFESWLLGFDEAVARIGGDE